MEKKESSLGAAGGEGAPIEKGKEGEITREKILEDLDSTLDILKKAEGAEQGTEEKERLEWILKSVEDALAKARDSEDGKYEVKAGEHSQREGLPVDELIRWLKEKAQSLSQEEAERFTQLAQELEKNSQDYWQAHFGKKLEEIKWTKEEEARQHWRTELEAYYISRDWRKTGDKDQDYEKAKEVMAQRRELVLPPKEEKKPAPEEAEIEPAEKPEEIKPEVKPEAEKEKVKAYVVEIEDVVKDLAILEANRRFGEIERKGKWWNPARIVKRSLLATNPDGWWLKFYKEALGGIRQNKNLMTEIETRLRKGKKITLPPDAEKIHYEDLDKILEAYSEGLVQEKEITEKGVVDPEIQKTFSEILVKHARDEFRKTGMSDLEIRKAFDKEVKTRIIDELIGKGKKFTAQERADVKAKESMYGHNFWEIAEKYKAEIQKVIQEQKAEFGKGQKEKIVDYVNGLMELDLNLGAKDPDIYQKDYRKLIERWEKCIKFSEKHRYLGSIVANPMVAGLSGSIAGNMIGRGVARLGLTAGLTTLAGLSLPVSTVLGGAGAAAICLWKREKKKGREELRRIMRDEALGFEPGGKQAQKIREKGGYSVKNAHEMAEKIKRIREKQALDDEDRKLITEALARRDLERQTGSILLKTVGEAGQKEKLRIGALNNLDREIKNTLDHFKLEPQDLKTERDDYITTLNQEMADKDKEFKRYLRKKGAIAAAGGVACGLAVGGGVYMGSRYLTEHFAPESKMAKLFEWWEGGKRAVPLREADLQEVPLAGVAGKIKIPEGYSLVQDAKAGEGIFDLLDSKGNILVDNLEIDNTGKLTDASKNLLNKAGFAFQEQVREITKTPGAGVHEWWQEKIGDLRKFNRVDWHDEPGRHGIFNLQFEGKQQQFHIRVDKEGVKLDFKKMMQNVIDNIKGKYKDYGTNWDQSVDTKLQHLASELKNAFEAGRLHEKFGINAIPDQIADSKGLGTFFGPLNEKYEYLLPQEKAKLLFDEDTLNKALEKAAKGTRAWLRETDLKLDHLEFYFGDQNGGHVFATATGKNKLPGIAYDYLIGEKSRKPWPAPPVPGFWPRRVPEKGTPKERGGGIYYGHYGFISDREYEKRRSPRFTNPEVELNEREEIDWYFDQQSSEYLQELEVLNQQIAEPMSKNCRLAVAIPAYKEERNIYHTLEQYLSQKDSKEKPLAVDSFEIIILDNHPEGKTRDQTREEVARFKKDHPEIKVHYTYKAFKEGEALMGNIRKYLNDLVLWRGKERKKQAGDLILVSNDADLEGLSPTYLETVRRRFDKDEKIDAITGKLDYPREAYHKLPIIHAARRLWQYFDSILRHKYLKAPELMGGNSAIKAGTYAALGGYNSQSGLGEDLEMGWMLKRARGDYAPRYMKYENRAKVLTDPRRAVLNYLEGKPHIKQHQDFIQNNEVRDLTWEQLLPKDRKGFEKEVFEGEADALYQYYKRVTWIPTAEFEKYFKRAMGFLGARYRIEKGHIKVENIQKLEKGLDAFKAIMEK